MPGQRPLIAMALLGVVASAAVAYRIGRDDGTIVVVDAPTPLWATEYDAARQGTIKPGPGAPIGTLAAGEKLPVVTSKDGKDYWAVEVRAKDGRLAWVLGAGQTGVRVVRLN